MKAEFTITFKSKADAERALKVLTATGKRAKEEQEDEEGARASICLEACGDQLRAAITAKDFAALRARSTSFLRDAKVVLDAKEAAQSKGK